MPNQQELSKGEGAAPKPPLPSSDSSGDGKKGGGKLLGELTVSTLLLLILGWLVSQNIKLYDEISKLKEKSQDLSERVVKLEQSKFALKDDLTPLTMAQKNWEGSASHFASKEDLSQVDGRIRFMITQLDTWTQYNFAEICLAGKGTFTSDNVCKLNGQQIIFRPLNLEMKK